MAHPGVEVFGSIDDPGLGILQDGNVRFFFFKTFSQSWQTVSLERRVYFYTGLRVGVGVHSSSQYLQGFQLTQFFHATLGR